MNGLKRLAALAAALGLSFTLAGEVFAGPTPEADSAFDAGIIAYKAGDVTSAVADWDKAAGGGHAIAAYLLGQLYENGNGVTKSEGMAFRYYKQAAALGQIDAMIKAGIVYRDGNKEIGVKRNYESAVELFEKAAIAGSSEAQFRLADMYRRGLGVPVSRSESLRWLILSGGKHYVPALLELARIHFDGDGVNQDRVAAWGFLILANRFADPMLDGPSVNKAMDKYDVRMKPGEKDASQKAADDWIAAHEAS
ncbi:MAG TPA: tetratricopeptide repeat protein [Parvibaculum sp.]